MLYILSSVMVTTTMSMVISHVFFSMFFYIGFFLFVFFMPVIFAIAVTSMPSSLFFVIIIISGSWRSWWRIMPIKKSYHFYFTNNSNLIFTQKNHTFDLGFLNWNLFRFYEKGKIAMSTAFMAAILASNVLKIVVHIIENAVLALKWHIKGQPDNFLCNIWEINSWKFGQKQFIIR